MKILCPVDFSIASIDAVQYAAQLLKKFDKREIELLHCSFPGDVSAMFDEYLEKHHSIVQENLHTLSEQMKQKAPEIEWTQQIIHGNPLDEISRYIKRGNYDLIAIGTKGLQNPDDRMFGSLTESLFEQSEVPILAIPQSYVFNKLQSIIMAIDDEVISSEKVVETLAKLARRYGSSVKLLHVKGKDDRPLEYNLDLDLYLKGINYEYYSKSADGPLVKAINEVCRHEKADLLSMIHRDRGWMFNLFHRSQVKEELDRLSMPILILHD